MRRQKAWHPEEKSWQPSHGDQWNQDSWQYPRQQFQERQSNTWYDTKWTDGTPYPKQWKPDEDHLDSNEDHGLSLGRRIAKTAWSTEKNIAGKLIHELTIADLAFAGHQNWYLRHISAGRLAGIEFVRSVKESMFVQGILKAIRSKEADGSSIDMDKLIQSFLGQSSSSSKLHQNYAEAAQKLIKHMKDTASNLPAVNQLDRVRELELQVADLMAAKEQSNSTTTPKKPKPNVRDMLSPGSRLPLEETVEEPDKKDLNEDKHFKIRRGDSNKVLSQDAPSTHTNASFTKWVKDKLDSKQMTKYLKDERCNCASVRNDWSRSGPLLLSFDEDVGSGQWLIEVESPGIRLLYEIRNKRSVF